MDCRRFRTDYSDFLDGVLAPADALEFRFHLDECEPCRRFDAAFRAGVAALRELDPPCPARDFSVRILHRVRRERQLPILAGGYGLAAALLTITLVGVVTVEVREHRDAAARATALTPAAPAAAALAPAAPASDDLDFLTVQMREARVDPLASDPYAAVPAGAPDSAYRYRVEVPAVWSGR